MALAFNCFFDNKDARIFIKFSDTWNVFGFLFGFSGISSLYSISVSSNWLRKEVQWIIDKIFKEKIMV